MNVDQLRDFCLAFPETTENIQWGDDLCFKFRGKIFATVALTVPQKVCFKCTPATFGELTEREGIHPAPYVGRYKWVILDSFFTLSDNDLREFVEQSYDMIAARAPKTKPKKSKAKITSRAKRRRRSG
jgi:predicted DNA-binding protein (MmcQ/YjbR family)